MYRCSWLLAGGQCANKTDKLVCDNCYPEKDKLYWQYKQKEKTVISALSSKPRGDIIEVSKVLGRLLTVIELRKKFTSRICKQTRDIGHRYHISNLLKLMNSYKEYASTLTQEGIEEYNDEITEENKTSCILSQQTEKLGKEIEETIEEDPFADFDHDIQMYKQFNLQIQEFVNIMSNEMNITKDETYSLLVVQALIFIHLFKSVTYKSIGNGDISLITIYKYSKNNKANINGNVIYHINKIRYDGSSLLPDKSKWILNHCMKGFSIITTTYKGGLVIGFFYKEDVCSSVYQIKYIPENTSFILTSIDNFDLSLIHKALENRQLVRRKTYRN